MKKHAIYIIITGGETIKKKKKSDQKLQYRLVQGQTIKSTEELVEDRFPIFHIFNKCIFKCIVELDKNTKITLKSTQCQA